MANRMTRQDLANLMDLWPHVMRLATDPWAMEFAVSIWKQAAERNWQPSPKQAKLMRLMVRQLPQSEQQQS